jgi:hypothetical protein
MMALGDAIVRNAIANSNSRQALFREMTSVERGAFIGGCVASRETKIGSYFVSLSATCGK